MIKKTCAIVFATAFASTAALAAEGDFAKADVNTDGALTMEEAVAAMPDLTAEQFNAADADQNGSLSEDEFKAIAG